MKLTENEEFIKEILNDKDLKGKPQIIKTLILDSLGTKIYKINCKFKSKPIKLKVKISTNKEIKRNLKRILIDKFN